MLTITADELPRLMQCNGSRLMTPDNIAFGKLDTKIRDEGIAAHYAAVTIFENRNTANNLVNTKAPNGIFITSEMIDYISDYTDVLINRGVTGNMEVETSWASVNGRADHISYNGDTLWIDDFKFGYRIIEPENNWTLISHAIGYCEQWNIQPKNICLTIYQPRAPHWNGHNRSHWITFNQLINYQIKIMEVLSAPSDTLETGPACAKCYALSTCPAAHKAKLNAIEATELVFDDNLTDERLAYELDLFNLALSKIENGLAAREELAKHRIRNGNVVKNYSVRTGLTNRNWKNFVTSEILTALTGKELTQPAKLITPKEAERRGIPSETLTALTERLPTELKLVRVESDKQARKLLNK